MPDTEEGETDSKESLQQLSSRQQQLDRRLQEVENYFKNELESVKDRQSEMEKEIELEGLELVNQQLKEINRRLNRLSDIITNNRKKIRQLKELSSKDKVLE